MARILIVDDEAMVRDSLSASVERMGYTVRGAQSLGEALRVVSEQRFDLILLDVHLPDGSGLEAIPAMRQSLSAPEVIIITGLGDAEGAELAINSGAWDYIQKPFTREEIMLQITRALEFRNTKSRANLQVSLKRKKIIGSSPEINRCLDLVAQCARSDTNVLISGETGTGKELFARAIHENSLHAGKGFIVVDCAALPEHLVESLLFGHVRGAFTGAERSQVGLIRQADGGTLFLDEVGELPLSIQKSFLRVLQERRVRPVGSTQEYQSNFRLVSATNQDLDDMVRRGTFRNDLLYRLRTFAIELPALRNRREDISDIAHHFIHALCRQHGRETKGFVPEFIEVLKSYDWPGNVRELIGALEKSILTATEAPVLFPTHLPAELRIKFSLTSVDRKRSEQSETHSPVSPPLPAILPISGTSTLKAYRTRVIERGERAYMQWLWSHSRDNVEHACHISGLKKSRLYMLLKKYDLPR